MPNSKEIFDAEELKSVEYVRLSDSLYARETYRDGRKRTVKIKSIVGYINGTD